MNILRVALIIVSVVLQYGNASSTRPIVKLQVFKPRGIRVIALWHSNITFFAFKGFSSARDEKIVIRGYGTRLNNSQWVYEDPSLKFEIGDMIQYRAFFSSEAGPYIINNTFISIHGRVTDVTTFEVDELEDRPEAASGQRCRPSRTILHGGTACKGQTLFNDDFNTLDTNVWQIEHYIPLDHPEGPFVSYQRLHSNPTVYVEDGKLYIQPRLQQNIRGFSNESIISGTLDLSAGCTRPTCIYHAIGSIIPPVVSGRVTSAHFAFTYGIITVRAKLPLGDWLYPEILLEPLANTYGSTNYASGVLKIAMALGNRDVNMALYSNRYLKGWPIMNGKCWSALQSSSSPALFGKLWGEQFHEYTLIWRPDSMEFAVDGTIYAAFDPGYEGLRSWLPVECRQDEWYSSLGSRGPMAPFDQHFFLTLGVAAGGIKAFPDDLRSRDSAKPWKNRERKANIKFWQALNDWYPTWNHSALVIDYIKVDAL